MKKAKRHASCHKEIALEQIEPLLSLIDQVIYTYFRWVLPKLQSRIYEREDLRHEGILGIIRAVQLYNPKKGKLANYARLHIRAKIGKFLWQNSFPNITIKRNPRIRLSFTPIDPPIGQDLPTTTTDIISLNKYQSTDSETEHQASVRKLVLLILRETPHPERKLLIKRFGICTCKNNHGPHKHQAMTLEQIGKEKAVSRERIRQRLHKIVNKIRQKRHKIIRQIKQEWQSL